MSFKIDRASILSELESVSPGLSPREIIEQSTCFVFRDGLVYTFNDELTCRVATTLAINGAVQAGPLLQVLRKLPDDTLTVEFDEEHLILKGKRREIGVRMESDILLPIDECVHPPEKAFKKMPEDWADAVKLVMACASNDETQFTLTCVNLTPTYVEASNNYQLARHALKLPVKKPTLVRRNSIKQIVGLGVTSVCETKDWMHFRSPAGLYVSVRRYADAYEDFSEALNQTGNDLTLPKGILDATERAEIFSSENADQNQVQVDIREGKVRITGEGVSGFYREVRAISYSGPRLQFKIDPDLLTELCKRFNDCIVNATALYVDGGRFQFCVSLGQTE